MSHNWRTASIVHSSELARMRAMVVAKQLYKECIGKQGEVLIEHWTQDCVVQPTKQLDGPKSTKLNMQADFGQS